MSLDALSQFQSNDWPAWARSGFLIALNSQTVLVGWGKPERRSDPGAAQLALYAPDFYLTDPSPWFVFPNYGLANTDDLVQEAEKRATESVAWSFNEPDSNEFRKRFDRVKQAIQKDEIRKAVPVVFQTGNSAPVQKNFASLIVHLFSRAGKRTPYGLWLGDEGILGASPEVLFHIRGNDSVLETMALAGTRLTDYELKSSLINDPKEMYEHDLVVRGLREKLAPMGELRITPTYIWDIGRICHLRTDIDVELEDLQFSAESFMALIKALHPTAALGLSPVSKPFQYLKNFEGQIERGRFGAPFGVWDRSGRTRVLVAIRNLIWKERLVQIGTGAGLVADSQFENEWREHQVKRQTVHELFGIE